MPNILFLYQIFRFWPNIQYFPEYSVVKLLHNNWSSTECLAESESSTMSEQGILQANLYCQLQLSASKCICFNITATVTLGCQGRSDSGMQYMHLCYLSARENVRRLAKLHIAVTERLCRGYIPHHCLTMPTKSLSRGHERI